MKISILIPAYNVEKYIEQSVQSTLIQTLTDIEIIIIDDGSTDKTALICDEIELTDSRIKVIHKKNEGLPSARNEGLKYSKGEYVLHLDGDDWIDKDLCKNAYELAKQKNADLVFMDFIRDDGVNYQDLIRDIPFPEGESVSSIECLLAMSLAQIHTSWNKLIRKQLYEEYNIFYPPDLSMAEDMATTHRLAMAAKTIVKHNKAYYHYRITPGSMITKKLFNGRDAYRPVQIIREFVESNPKFSSYTKFVEFHDMYRQYRWDIRNLTRAKKNAVWHEIHEDFLCNSKKLKDNHYFNRIPIYHRILISAYAFHSMVGILLHLFGASVYQLLKYCRNSFRKCSAWAFR